jgi:hypothetical protein
MIFNIDDYNGLPEAARNSLTCLRGIRDGLRCSCSVCCRSRVRVSAPVVPPLPQAEPMIGSEAVNNDDPDWKV